ncbi:multidrug and toxin extrusion protein 1-like isoform X3 [Stegostoma tigrinum]|uniref:multidrug and toxin extrusion protein 1-like isoform X3 n=1 Tax=Stegostoma tigrinum TaxID=3053191 RepID=UPI00202B3EAE|nr:multidrug and toxin extrusion protein 1-like isoform X3 [Stegostoma tigrinum]
MTDLMPATSNTTRQSFGICGNLFLRKMKRIIPINFWQETKRLTLVAVPVFLSQLMNFLTSIVSAIFCGHLGRIELDAFSLATAVVNISGVSVGVGLSLACDTFISQTYGSKNLKRIGVILQRGILILLIVCFPCWALFVNTENILLAFKQPPEVVKLTNLYVLIFIPALPGITLPQVFIGVLVTVLNAITNYLLLNIFSLGVQGSAAAITVSQYCQATFLFIYIRWRKLHVNTWAAWSTDCLQEWGLFVKLAIPSMLMLCFEWWSYEVGSFLADEQVRQSLASCFSFTGTINEVELGAQAVVYQILQVTYMLPLGYGVASAVHVGNALGAGNPERAKNVVKTALWCSGFLALVISVVLKAVSDVIGYIFTNDKEIIQLVGKLLPLIATNQFFDALVCVNSGVLRGTGKQRLGAIGNLVGFYLIGFPIGISLTFAAKFGIIGYWYGMTICVIFQYAFFQIVIYKINWNEASNQAQAISGVKTHVDPYPRPSVEQNECISSDVNNEVHSGSIAVITVGDATPVENNVNAGQVREESLAPKMNVEEKLSLKQLIVRRGIAVLSGLLILVIGLLLRNM